MLEIRNLNFNYENKKVLTNVSFDLNKGIKALVAPNGAGKTTLLNCISQKLSAKGNIMINGKDFNNREILKHLTFLGDHTILDVEMTLYDYLNYIAKIYGIPKNKIKEIMDLTDVSHFCNDKIKTYSLGMKNRSMVALSILPDTKYILLDEPLSGLDPGSVKKMKSLLLKLTETKGIILSSHILDDVNDLTEDILFLKDGKIIEYHSYALDSLKLITDNDLKAIDLLKSKDLLKIEDELIISNKNLNDVLGILLQNNIEISNILNLRDSLKNEYFEMFT